MKIILVVLSLSFVLLLSATIINIPAEQPTIQAGINIASEGDTILVQPGIYQGSLNFLSKGITLASLYLTTQNTYYIAETVIDCASIIYLEDTFDSQANITGFQLYGSEIYIDQSSVVINNCDIYHPIPSAFYICNYSNVSIESCKIHSVRFGRSMNAANSNISIINSMFYDLGGDEGNGSISVISCNIQIINSVIIECIPVQGYSKAIICTYSDLLLLNSIMWNNSSGNIQINDYCNVTIAYSCIQNGQESISGDISSLAWLDGNIEDNPSFSNTAIYDLSLDEESLCIGAGIDQLELNGNVYSAPSYDHINNPRPSPVGSMPDIGAIEHELAEPNLSAEDYIIWNSSLTNYPNPFNPTTTIEFSIQNNSKIELAIYNIKGQKIKSLLSDQIEAGEHSIVWNGEDDSGKKVGSGVYIYMLNVNGRTELVKKCLLLK